MIEINRHFAFFMRLGGVPYVCESVTRTSLGLSDY